MTLPILYSFRRCPYAMRARLALAVAGIRLELREVLLRDKPAAMLAASPKGTVPVLVLPDGAVIDESLEIMRWALRQHDPENWLASDDEFCQQDVAGLIELLDTAFKSWLDAYKYPERHPELATQNPRQEGFELLKGLDERLQRHGQLCRARTTLADAAWVPFVRQFAHVDRDWFYRTDLTALQAWLRNWLESPLFAAIMTKHQAWAPGDPPVVWDTTSG